MKDLFFGCLPPVGKKINYAAYKKITAEMSTDSIICKTEKALLFSKHPRNFFKDENFYAIVTGRPRWENRELNEIAHNRNNAAALVQGWKQFNHGVLKYLRNQFSFILFNLTNNTAFLAIDRLGINSLYYTKVDGYFIFGTNLQSVLANPLVNHKLDPQGIFNYLYFHMIPSPGTAYDNVEKLEPAHELFWNNGSLYTDTYWTPPFIENTSQDMGVACREFMTVMSSAVKDAAKVHRPVGSFLSGGIDSSTVSGLLAQELNTSVNTYSIGFHAEGYDEIPYARIASEHFKTHSHEYYVKPKDIVETVHTIASAYEEPFGNSSALPAYYCAREAAADGIRLLLAGDGGDELFAGNQRYAKQFIFEKYYTIPKLLRLHVLEPISRHLKDSNITLLRKPASYVEQARIPLPDRFESYNYLHRISSFSEIFVNDFLSKVDTEQPLRLMRDRYNEPDNASILNRMLYLDWKFTLADNDIRKVSGMCRLAGVDVAYPMMDDQVLDLSCGIPSSWKLSRGKLRYFFKRSVEDFLPPAIISKKKHGFGLPFGVWTSSNPDLQALAYQCVRSLEKRGIFNTAFLENAITLHKEGHSAYYGNLIWVLMMLELWFKTHNL